LGDAPQHTRLKEIEARGKFKKFLSGSSITEPSTEEKKRGRPVSEATIRRADFAKPLRESGKTWPEIYDAYIKRYPRDVDTESEDVLRLAFERQYPEISDKLKSKPPTE